MKIRIKPGTAAHDTIVFVEGKPLGCVEHFSYEVNSRSLTPLVTITFMPTELKIGKELVFSSEKLFAKKDKKCKE
jgi:hypothetical protein